MNKNHRCLQNVTNQPDFVPTGVNIIKLFLFHQLTRQKIKLDRSSMPKFFQGSLLFVSIPRIGHPWVGSTLTHNLKKIAKDKHSSLF